MSQPSPSISSIEPINSVQPTQLAQSPELIIAEALTQQSQPTQPKRIDPPCGTQEVWVSLESQGFPNHEVSTFGRVRNAKRKNVLKGNRTSTDYILMCMTDLNGVNQIQSIHVLVAIAFIPNPEGKPTVDHIDRIRDNNYVGNLRWATRAEQAMNRNGYQRQGRAVYQYSIDDKLINRWDSILDAAQNLGLTDSRISSACSGKRLTTGGYKWKYCDEVDVLEGEEWRPIPYQEYPNVQASSLGRIKFSNGRITEGTDNGDYKFVNLVIPGTTVNKVFSVYRLVAAAFYGRNDDPNIIVNHKDGNKMNNRADNLEYTTKKGKLTTCESIWLTKVKPL